MKTLAEIYQSHTGKISDKWELYLREYDRLFSPYRTQPISILEIGIQNGGSLEIWGKYFLNATKFVGCDINPNCAKLNYDDSRIAVVIGDATTDETKEKITRQAEFFDIIIDDGSHVSGDIVQAFAKYFSMLREGGIFVAEDLHCSYWQAYEGGIFHPYSSINFFKGLADIINHEHWGIDKLPQELISGFGAKYGVSFDKEVLSNIHSIELINSLCVIRKSNPANNCLGLRTVSGHQETVVSGISLLHGQLCSAPRQSKNPWSYHTILVDDELPNLFRGLIERDGQITRLTSELETLRVQVALVEKLTQEKMEQEVRYAALIRSTSWRVTRPLRVATALARGNPAYFAQLGRLPIIRNVSSFFVSGKRQMRRAQRIARLVLQLSQREGGIAPLMRIGIRIMRQQGLNGLYSKLCQLDAGSASSSTLQHDDITAIAREIFARQQAELSPEMAQQIQCEFEIRPLISVIMPVYKTPVQWLRRAIESLQEQYYDRWELCAVDDCSPGDEQRKLLQELAAGDARVRFTVLGSNGGISTASNAALEMAKGEYIALLDHDDELTPDALFRVVEVINQQQGADFIYSDECIVNDTVSRQLSHFIFKPDWSPELMFNAMLTGHLTVYRKNLVEGVGGFRSGYDFSQDYDLALRMAERAKRIVHIERLLYLWRSIPGSAAADGKPFARETNIAALNDALRRRGIPGEAIPLPHANYVRITLPMEPPLVSLVIPSDSVQNLRLVLRSIWENTDYVNLEVLVVCNGPLADRLMGEFSGWPSLRFVKYDKKYNFSDKCNEGAEAARGEIVVFYNDDVFPRQRDWVERLIEYLWVPGVGGVSPKLLHADDTIQYAGMISGTPGLCGTAYNSVMKDATDPFLTMHRYVRNVSILSGACCAFRKDVFQKVGGFDTVHTPDGHSDMDLSYKLIEAGYRCVYTPHALLTHIGNHSWGAKPDKYKADIYVLKRWGALLSKDPYFTDSMKRVLYHDFRFEYRIYAEHLDQREHYAGPDILFVSHELTLTGAPRMLFYAACIVRRNGGFPVVVAPADGPMREELIKAGITVIIDESICHNHFLFERFARNFDLAVINTVALADVVRQLSAIPILRSIWWLHEAQSLSSHLKHLPDVEWERVCTLCVSDYAKSFVPPGISVEILRNGIPDQPIALVPSVPTTPMTFVLAGTIEPRKGQDIFVEAVEMLPAEVRRQCRFLLTGKLWDERGSFWTSLQAKMTSLPEIEYLGLLDHQSLLHLISAADMVVCCSRDDPSPLVVAEAAMLSKPVILSRCVGSIEVLEDASCLVFEPENVASLAEQLRTAYEKRGDLPEMGMVARRSFEEQLTLEAFTRRFVALISAQTQIAKDG